MSTGEALVYRGTDPSDAAAWALVGSYKMGQPFNVRGTQTLAGDVIVLTRSGWDSFKNVIMEGQYKIAPITRNMTGFSRSAALNYHTNENWDMVFFTAGAYMLINIPIADGSTYAQHLLNTNTGKWATLSGWQANTFGVFDQDLFFGDQAGVVYRADTGVSDNGDEILTDALPAFNYLTGRANNKQLTGIRAITDSSEADKIAYTACADYLVPDAPPTDPSTMTPATTPWGSLWDISYWEPGNDAAPANGVWQSKSAFGYSVSYRMALASNFETVRWISTQLMFKEGGII